MLLAAKERSGCEPDGLSEHLNAKNICQNLFGFTVQIGVNECNVVIGGNAVSESTETLHKRIRYCEAAEVIEQKPSSKPPPPHAEQRPNPAESCVYAAAPGQSWSLAAADLCCCPRRGGRRCGNLRCCCGSEGGDGGLQNEAAPGPKNGYVVSQLGLEDGVKVLTPADGNHGVSIGQLSEDADFVAIFELGACGHRGVTQRPSVGNEFFEKQQHGQDQTQMIMCGCCECPASI